MAIPSGSGSERLRRATLHSNGGATEILSGTAGHLYTILSITAADQSGADTTIEIRINDGSNEIKILAAQVLPANGSFVWDNVFVMEEDDDLDVNNTGVDCDWYLSYIDQDWT